VIAAAPPVGGIQRGRGGFLRSTDGKPYVTDPSGATVKSGARKGEPKRLAYGSPSSAGKMIENTYNLQKWGERMTVLGVGIDAEVAAACMALTTLERDSDEFKAAADAVVVAAKAAAKANLAAERGTHTHALSEDHDEDRNWLLRAEEGEDLGLPTEVQAALVDAWRQCLEENGLEIIAVEASCVDDTWRLAGTLDRIARTTHPLRFVVAGGEIIEVPAGEVLVLDVKSGKRTTDGAGVVQYWHSYAVQVASYAQSVPYDTTTEVRAEWPHPISQTHALIAHLDVLGALDGAATCTLVHVDLVAAREHGGATVQQAKSWAARKDVFSVASVTTATEPATGFPFLPAAPLSHLVGDGSEGQVEPEAAGAAPAPACPPSPAEQLATLNRATPIEGDAIDEADAEALERAYVALDAVARAWITALAKQATQAHVSFHLKGNRTLRRFELLRGLVELATHGITDDETLRAVLASIHGDCAWFPAVTPGHLVGALDATDAAVFAQRCTVLATALVPGEPDARGNVVLRFDLVAA
jgi:hypothetical protein